MGRLMKKLAARLRQEGPVDLSPQVIAAFVAERIEARVPTAVVRFGEAEARLLVARDDDDASIDIATRKLQRQTGLALVRRDVLRVGAHVRNALVHADVLGIRGSKSFSAEHLAWVQTVEEELARQLAAGRKPVLVSHYLLSQALSEALPEYFNLQKRVSVVSCRELTPLLEERYGLTDIATYQIPSQFDKRHVDGVYEAGMHGQAIWPDFYRELEERVTVREPGEIFLVGAGLFGKNLCIAIRKKGGIALDLGSRLDLLAGKVTRGEAKARPRLTEAYSPGESSGPSDETGTVPARSLFTPERDSVGVHEIARGVAIEVLETVGEKRHTHFRGSFPESNGIEESFRTGPVALVHAEDAVVDVQAGLTLLEGVAVRETAVTRLLADNYGRPPQSELENAARLPDDGIVLPLASQRMANFCRFWLDSVAKHFIAGRSPLLKQRAGERAPSTVVPAMKSAFQWGGLGLLSLDAPLLLDGANRFYRGRSVNMSGLAFGGGQSISHMTPAYSAFLRGLLPSTRAKGGERLFISRNEAGMRRILNEEDLVPKLRDLGFTIFVPERHAIPDQIAAFNRAKVVLSAHGAGLTSILFCNPGTTLIEIFPEGGVHPSAFHRIASMLEFPYYHIVGEAVQNRAGAKNPNNLDLSLDVPGVVKFLKTFL